MKKQIALALTAAMTVGMLAGCSGKTPTAAGGSTVTSTGSETTAAAGDDKTITFWNIATDEPDKTIWSYAVDQYNKNDSPTSGYTIDQVATANDQYKQKLSVAMSAGQCPDMYIHWTGGPMREYIKSGYAQDITDIVDELGLRDKYLPAALDQCTVDGKDRKSVV